MSAPDETDDDALDDESADERDAFPPPPPAASRPDSTDSEIAARFRRGEVSASESELTEEAQTALSLEDEDGESSDPRALIPAGRRGPPRRAPSNERLYIVAYDIADPKRWRRVFRTMKGYGRWLQLSVFQCRLSGRRRADLGAALERLIHHGEDHVIILDLGLADEIDPRVESFGKSFTPITREAVIV